MADWNKPDNASNYNTDVHQTSRAKDESLAKMDFTGDTNIPTGAIRWSDTNKRFEKYNGSTWDAVIITSDAMLFTGKIGVDDSSPDAGLDIATTTRIEDDTNSPTTGKGMEMSYNTTSDTAVIQAYDRDTTAYKIVKLLASSLQLNGDTSIESNPLLVGTNVVKTIGSSYSGQFLGSGMFLMSQKGSLTSSPDSYISNNAYYNSSGEWRYIRTGYATMIRFSSTGEIAIFTAVSGTAGALVNGTGNWTTAAQVLNNGSITVGAGLSGQGIGTVETQNGTFCAGNRNNRIVTLTTPELIGTGTGGAWTTVANTTLQNANAKAAYLKYVVSANSDNSATTDYASIKTYLRETGSALATGYQTMAAQAFASCDVVGLYADVDNDTNTMLVSLDSSSQFDYYELTASSGVATFLSDLYLLGYVQDC